MVLYENICCNILPSNMRREAKAASWSNRKASMMVLQKELHVVPAEQFGVGFVAITAFDFIGTRIAKLMTERTNATRPIRFILRA
jgi:hypothetical protein